MSDDKTRNSFNKVNRIMTAQEIIKDIETKKLASKVEDDRINNIARNGEHYEHNK